MFKRSTENIDWISIIQGCIDNKRKSQETLYRHFFPIMEKMIKRHTTDVDQQIDILNNGFLKVFKKIDTFNHKGSFEGWIRKIVYHAMCDYFRKYSKDVKFLVFENVEYELKTKAKHDLHFQDLMKMVKKLPEKHYKVFHMFAIEGYKHEEIGGILEINVNTSKWYLAEARKKLQQQYKAEWSKYV